MRKASLIADGLWQCLCPRFTPQVPLTRLSQQFYYNPKQKRLLSGDVVEHKPIPITNGTSSVRTQDDPAIPWKSRKRVGKLSRLRWGIERRPDNGTAEKWERLDYKRWSEMSTPELYSELHAMASRGRYSKTHNIIDLLARARHEPPNLKLFSAKILVNVHDTKGSAVAVAETLKELRSEDLQPDLGLCHDVLRVLAIHPDYLLQTEILDYMRQRWFSVSVVGEHDIVVSLLADHQYELALDRLERMCSEDIVVQSWLQDMTVHVLLENEEVETAFRFMKASVNRNEDYISPAAWYQLLGVASGNYHYDATVYTWRLRVGAGYLNPPSGICINVLNTAARYGDTQLATDVLRVLGDRGTTFGHEHYEALIDSYATHGDIDTALRVLCLMDSQNVRPDSGTTRTIIQAIKSSKGQTDKAFQCLQKLKSTSQKVPIAALNVIIEATVQQERQSEAFEQYQALHDICDQGPNTDTFNILLRGCRKDKKQAIFIASEMRALEVPANELTYDRMLLACLLSDNEDHEDAMRYYVETKSQGWKLRRGTHFMLLKRCVEAVDMRAPEILKDMLHLQDNSYISSKKWFENNWAGPPIDDLPETPEKNFRSPRSRQIESRSSQASSQLGSEGFCTLKSLPGDETVVKEQVESSG